MRQNQKYQELLALAIANNYTVAQIQGATLQQVENLSGVTIPADLFDGVKECLIKDLANKDEDVNLINVQNRVISTFPNAEFSRGREGGKRFYAIWPDGKPEDRD